MFQFCEKREIYHTTKETKHPEHNTCLCPGSWTGFVKYFCATESFAVLHVLNKKLFFKKETRWF